MNVGKLSPNCALASLLSAAMCVSFTPAVAWGGAASTAGDLSVITKGTEGTDYAYSDNVLYILSDKAITISGSTATSYIVVPSNVTANITLNNASIDMSAQQEVCAFSISSGSSVSLTLSGSSTLKSGEGMPGLEVRSGSSLTITSASTGSLKAVGGELGGAGIGSACSGTAGSITISGGTVEATGTNGGAGIGRGLNGTFGSFSTGLAGNAVIFASSISDQSGKEKNSWRGVIFEGAEGQVCGLSAERAISPTSSFTIPENTTLTIESGSMLETSANVSITNNGSIVNNGYLVNNGALHNQGALSITRSGQVTNKGSIENDGTITNSFILANYGGATITNSGSIVSSNRLTNNGEIYITASGTITNDSLLHNAGSIYVDGALNGPIAENVEENGPVYYPLTLDAAGGKIDALGDGLAERNSTTYYNSFNGAALPTPLKSGYTFNGWYASNGAKVTEIAAGSTGTVILTASWQKIPAAQVAKANEEAVSKVKNKKLTVSYGTSKSIHFKTKLSAASTTVVYAKASGSKYISVTKAGKVTAKKGLKRGKYTAKVKVTCGKAKAYVKVVVNVI